MKRQHSSILTLSILHHHFLDGAIELIHSQTAREVAEATGQSGMNSTLMEFGACAVALSNILYQDKPLTDVEFRFMENHFQVIEMAYLWKRKHRATGRELG
ncbi:MAG: hypothetical protein ABI980_11625 [Nitrospirota bacterium]